MLIKQATITDPNSPFNKAEKDILIQSGTIKKIGDQIEPESETTISDWEKPCISPGWVDMRANFCDPGFENMENLESGTRAASAGGITHVGLLPQTYPPLSTKSQIQYIHNQAPPSPTSILPYATISKPESESEITEMVDLYRAGAYAFTNGDKPVKDAGLLKRAMLYTRSFNGLLMLHPQHAELKENGEMNEGTVNVMLGLKGDPEIAEHIAIARDLEIARYSGARIHFTSISTARSVAQIQEAKKEGLAVSCDVSIFHLLFSESDLMDYDTNLKHTPPLRKPEDMETLRQGVQQGNIDAVVSNHTPVLYENKKCEFPLAEKGAIGTQLLYPLLNQAFSPETFNDSIIQSITEGPKKLLGIPVNSVQENQPADLTIFNPNEDWFFDKATNYSHSHNTPFYNKTLTGRPLGIMNKGQMKLL